MGDYYDHSSFPSQGSAGQSATMRAELDKIAAGFGKLPSLSGNNGKALVVGGGGTLVTVTAAALTLSGSFTKSGTDALTLTTTAPTTLTLPTTGTLASLAGSATFTNKHINAQVLGGNITGTYTLGGTPTITPRNEVAA